MNTPWDALHRAYFNGEALWTYLDNAISSRDGWRAGRGNRAAGGEGAETWRVLRAHFPGSIETHSLIQDFFFGEDLEAAPPRLQREHRRRVSWGATDFGLCGGGRHSLPTEAPRLHART